MKRFSFVALVALVFGLTTTGCATNESQPVAPPVVSTQPVWPKPPAEPRIRYVRDIRTAQDWGIERSWLRRLVDRILGSGNDRLVRPAAVAQWQQVLYVADPGVPALWIFDADRHALEKVQRVGAETLQSPVALAPRPDGSVYLADSALKKIFLIARDGQLLSVIPTPGLQRPAGLAYDAARQRLYVADSAGQQIRVLGNDGVLLARWGQSGKGDGEFNFPTHLAADADGNVLVTDALNFRVQAFDMNGRFLWKFGRHGDAGGDIASPKGVALDRDNHVFLVDALFDVVQIFDRNGQFLLAVGDHGSQPGQFWLPAGLFINATNDIYVADAYNQRVQVLQVIAADTDKRRP